MNLAGLPVHPLSAGMLGVQILDFSDPDVYTMLQERLPGITLPYDEMFISYSLNAIVVGELSHFLWRQLQLAANQETRDAAGQHIRKTAERILGEPWELAERQ